MNRKSPRKNRRKNRNRRILQNNKYQRNYRDYDNSPKYGKGEREAYTSPAPPLPPSNAPNVIPHYCPHPKPANAATDILPQYLRHYIYIWTDPDKEFWMYPTQIDQNALHGYVWDDCSWIYSHVPINQINGFY